jgi:hypothetical protein
MEREWLVKLVRPKPIAMAHTILHDRSGNWVLNSDRRRVKPFFSERPAASDRPNSTKNVVWSSLGSPSCHGDY